MFLKLLTLRQPELYRRKQPKASFLRTALNKQESKGKNQRWNTKDRVKEELFPVPILKLLTLLANQNLIIGNNQKAFLL